jgi:hypothetical protein
LSLAGWFPVNHGLNTFPSGVTVWDGSGERIGPDDVEVLSVNLISVWLASFMPFSGTFTIAITT